MWVQSWLDGSELTWVPEPPYLNNLKGASSLECTVVKNPTGNTRDQFNFLSVGIHVSQIPSSKSAFFGIFEIRSWLGWL